MSAPPLKPKPLGGSIRPIAPILPAARSGAGRAGHPCSVRHTPSRAHMLEHLLNVAELPESRRAAGTERAEDAHDYAPRAVVLRAAAADCMRWYKRHGN